MFKTKLKKSVNMENKGTVKVVSNAFSSIELEMII